MTTANDPKEKLTDMISAVRPATRLTRSLSIERYLPLLVAVGIVLALAVTAGLTRLYRISEIPPGIINDEGANGVDALRVLQGEHAVFFAEKASGREAMAIYAIALATRLLGPSLLAFHLPAALASVVTVFAVFWLGLLLFGKDEESGDSSIWRGLTVAGIGAGLLAASIGQTFLARGGFRANFLPLILSLSLALMWYAWSRTGPRNRNMGWVVLAGACVGLLPYTYIPARFTPFLFFILGLSFLIPFGPAAMGRVRAEWLKAGVFVAAAGLVAAPILIYFLLHPEDFFFRSLEISLSRDGSHSEMGTFLNNVVDYLLVFGVRGDRNWEYNFAGMPLLNAWQAIFFWTGVGVALWRWRRRPSYRLLLIWLGVMILPAMFTYNRGNGPNTLRIIGAAPAAYLLVGVGMWETVRLLNARFPRLKKTFPATLVGALVIGLVLVQGMFSYRIYFNEWRGTPAYYAAADAELAEAARVLNLQSSPADTVYLIPYSLSNGHYGFDYLYQGTAPAHVIHATTTHLPQKLESTLAGHEDVSIVKVVDWNDDLDWIGGGEEHTIALLNRYGTLLDSEEYQFFQIHSYSEMSFNRNWTFYDQLGPPSVHYDGGISLQGFAMGQGETQLSTQQTVDLGQQRSFWIAMQWQIAPELETEYAISLRLHSKEEGGVYQKDIVLLNTNRSRTDRWAPEKPVETLIHIKIPDDLESGQYELRLVVYDYETLKPTVELGVWEAETVLTTLQISLIQ